jgi:ABC-type transporter Mla maintaining outer membrane lipid asymmetry ATPase subunit MlaF
LFFYSQAAGVKNRVDGKFIVRMLELKNVCKSFGDVRVLNGVNVCLEKGFVYVLKGGNNSIDIKRSIMI